MDGRRLAVWPPLPLHVYLRRSRSSLPFPLDRPGCVLFARGRQALFHGLRALGLASGDEVLAPAYHHGSEIEALSRAGLRCRFYGGLPTLEPDEEELSRLLTPRIRALHLIHYLGFPQDGPRWRRWCDEHGLLLIEDCAQAWLAESGGRPVGSDGDLSIFCLYKTFGLPLGAALLTRVPVPGPTRRSGAGLGTVSRRHAAWLAARSSPLAALARRLERGEPYDPASDFALGDPDVAPFSSLRFLLPRVADTGAAGRRRANFSRLLRDLAAHVPSPFTELPAGAVPFGFPIESGRRGALVARLAGQGVHAGALWSLPHPALPAGRFPYAGELRRRLALLPVHQELAAADLELIAAAARRALAETGG